MLRKMFKKNRKLTAALTLGVCLAAAAPSAFALNVAGDGTGTGNKPFSFTGYKFDPAPAGADTLELNFNKETTSPGEMTAAMFTVKDADGYDVAISSVNVSNTTGDYDGGSHYTKGSKAIITFNGDLTEDALYTVTINGRLMDKNGLTLGNYANGKDLTFKFRTPDSFGDYNADFDPYVTYVVGDGTSNVSWESDLTVIFDRPFSTDSTKLANFKSALNSGYTKGGNQVSLGDTSGSYEAYTVKSNDTNSVNTVFYFPETKNSSTSPVFNRSQSSNTYTLTLPGTFYDVNDQSYTNYTGGNSFQFTTVSSDYPGWEMNASTASGTNAAVSVALNGTTLTVGWYDTWVDPNPTGYKVYAINSNNGNQYTDLASWTLLGTHIGHTDGQYESHNYTVTSGTYYVRVVPYNATGSVGPSKSGNN